MNSKGLAWPAPGVLLLAACLLVACGAAPDLDHPKDVRGPGFSFRMPGNWTVAQEAEQSDGQKTTTVTVEGRSDSLVMLFAFDPALALDLDGFAAGMRTELTAQVHDQTSLPGDHALASASHGESKEIQRDIAGGTREGRRLHWRIRTLGIDVPHTIELFGLTSPTRSFVLFTQAPDEDLDRERPGFDLLLQSLQVQ